VALERAARGAAVVCLAYALWLSWFGVSPFEMDRSPPAPPLSDSRAVAAWLANPRTVAAELVLDAIPTQAVRAVLHAGQRAGVGIRWRAAPGADAVRPLALSAEALRDPSGGMVVRAAGDAQHVVLRDAVGVLDSAALGADGAQWMVRGEPRRVSLSVVGAAPAVHSTTVASAVPARFGAMRRVLVLGAPSWETRFTMLALEEAGWAVDGVVDLSPSARVSTGRLPAAAVAGGVVLDTARYAAVIALDSSAWVWGARISAFVRQGGGAVVMASAVDGAPLTFPRAASRAATLAPIPGALTGARPPEGLPLQALDALSGAVVLETDSRTGVPVPAAVARALGAGRLLQVGWEGLWEWRMAGGDDAVEEHRAWWRSALGRVAARTRDSTLATSAWATRFPGDAAPYADLAVRLGAPSTGVDIARAAGLADAVQRSSQVTQGIAGAADTTRGVQPPLWLFVVAALVLVVEWWSRRLRGAR